MKHMKRKIANEGYYKGELLTQARDNLQEAIELLSRAGQSVRKVLGERDHIYQRLDSNARDVDDTLDEIQSILEEKEFGYSDLVDESGDSGDRGKSWFDPYGWMVKTIPGDCVVQCSGSGKKDDAVEFWVKELDFDKGFPHMKAVNFLREFGAWDENELTGKTDTELAQIVLWEFCNELRDMAYDTDPDDLKSVGLSEDPNDWSSEDWMLFQTDLSSVSLNI